METQTAATAPGGGNSGSNPPGATPGQADRLLAQHGSDKHKFVAFGSLPPKPGSAPRGRPRKDGLPPGSILSTPAPRNPPLAHSVETQTTPDGLPRPRVDPGIIRRAVEAIITTVDNIVGSFIQRKAEKLVDKGEARLVAEAAKCAPENKTLIAHTLPPVLEKYGVNTDNLPEMGLLTGICAWVAGPFIAIQQLQKMIEEKEKREKLQALHATASE